MHIISLLTFNKVASYEQKHKCELTATLLVLVTHVHHIW